VATILQTLQPSASAALQAMSLMALGVLLSKQRAAMPMGGSGSKAGAVAVCGVCRQYRIHSCAVNCNGDGRGTDACVVELHIVASHIRRRLSRAVNRGSAAVDGSPPARTGDEGDIQGLAQSLRTLGRREDFLVHRR